MDVLRLVSAVWLVGCLGTNPEERLPELQGDFRDGNSEHRPGQPCITCHNDEPLLPIAPPFELGGTVYGEVDAAANRGLSNVDVLITDAAGHELVARTNRAGNFYIEVNPSLDAPSRWTGGRLEIPWSLKFPLRTSIRRGDEVIPMKTRIWRARSCATCHGEDETEDSVGRVFFDEEAVP